MLETQRCSPLEDSFCTGLTEAFAKYEESGYVIPFQGKHSTYNMKSVIRKSCPDRSVRKLLVTHFGLEPNDFHKYNLDDQTIDKEIDILMSLPLVLETRYVNPYELDLFKSPLFSNIKIMQNQYTDSFLFAGKLGGSSDLYDHPIVEMRREMRVNERVVSQLESIQRESIPIDRQIKVLCQHIHLYHGEDKQAMEFFSKLQRKL